MLQVRVGSSSHVGNVREVNEDALLVGRQVFAVADGMGGYAAGDVASRETVTILSGLEGASISPASVRRAIASANNRLSDYARAHPESSGLGTTVAGVAVLSSDGYPHVIVFHVGDSRVYRFVDNTLRQVTMDHSEVAALVANGRLTPDQARVHPSRHVVTRAVGGNPPGEADIVVLPVQLGERWVIVSDGVTSEISDTDLCRCLAWKDNAQQAADAVTEAALSSGGNDNISIIVVDIVDQSLTEQPDGTTVPRSTEGADVDEVS